jgi:hypothetical protein
MRRLPAPGSEGDTGSSVVESRSLTRVDWLLGLTVLLFQSHWLDDLGSGAPDTAGVIVSAIGTALVVAGAFARGSVAGRVVLRAGLTFVALISLADLVALRPDGSLRPDLITYYRMELGRFWTLCVAVTLVGAFASLARVRPPKPALP